MIGWNSTSSTETEVQDFAEPNLGDVLRGERATLGLSLLDIQRDLRIKAAYIAAIENADLSAFDAPAFAAGYVRSYARHLKVDPEWAFAKFCAETGYVGSHGLAPMAQAAKGAVVAGAGLRASGLESLGSGPLLGRHRAPVAMIDLRALGSVAVLSALVLGLGYAAWSVLQEVQRVHLAPVDQAPAVVAQLDPLAAQTPALASQAIETTGDTQVAAIDPLTSAPQTPAQELADGGDRLFRPAALETPVLVSRDGPIAAIDPKSLGAARPSFTDGGAQTVEAAGLPMVQALGADAPAVEVIAVRPSWVRIQATDGAVLFEKVLNAGERVALPKLEQAPVLRTGESGAIYFAVAGQAYGPAGAAGSVTKNIALAPETLTTTYQAADLAADADLAKFLNVADASAVLGLTMPAPEEQPQAVAAPAAPAAQ